MKNDLPIVDTTSVFEEIVQGLNNSPKTLPSKLFYDKRGSELFDRICELDEYYPTRTEITIMKDNIKELSDLFDDRTLLIEFGSGSSLKTQLLLDNINSLAGYIPIDISEEHLLESVDKLQLRYPELNIYPVASDYTGPIGIPDIDKNNLYKIAYFPGSTLGNFTTDSARKFVEKIGYELDETGALLIGIDMVKDISILEKAYNDSNGITALFNLNILERINNEFDADFSLNEFRHVAFYNKEENRIEMHLVSKNYQTVTIGEEEIVFEKEESIITEYSHKYTIESFTKLTEGIFKLEKVWTDDKNYFSLIYLSVI